MVLWILLTQHIILAHPNNEVIGKDLKTLTTIGTQLGDQKEALINLR